MVITICLPNAGLMLVHCLWRWPNIKPALGKYHVSAGYPWRVNRQVIWGQGSLVCITAVCCPSNKGWWFNVGFKVEPASSTLAQHWTNIESILLCLLGVCMYRCTPDYIRKLMCSKVHVPNSKVHALKSIKESLGATIQSPGGWGLRLGHIIHLKPARRRAENFKLYYMFIYPRTEIYYLFHVGSAFCFKNTPDSPPPLRLNDGPLTKQTLDIITMSCRLVRVILICCRSECISCWYFYDMWTDRLHSVHVVASTCKWT